MDAIEHFRGPYQFCSNFAYFPAELDGERYRTVEHAFAAAKTLDSSMRAEIQSITEPGAARRAGRAVTLRPDWDEIKTSIMHELLTSKFVITPSLRQLLLDTGDDLLIEGNTWGDTTWGRCQRHGSNALVGANRLGRLLMTQRRRIRGDSHTRWPRVAVTGHRAHLIPATAHAWVQSELARLLTKLSTDHSTTVALSGLATGADSWWGEAAIAEGTSLWTYQPFPEQPARWSSTEQDVHARLCAASSRHIVIGNRPSNTAFDQRNQLMLTDADALIAVRDPNRRSGGTVNALTRHLSGIPVITVDIRHRRTTINQYPEPTE